MGGHAVKKTLKAHPRLSQHETSIGLFYNVWGFLLGVCLTGEKYGGGQSLEKYA